LEVEYVGQPPEQQAAAGYYNTINYYRSHIEEFFWQNNTRPLPPLEGRCLIHFAATDRVSIRYELRNSSRVSLGVRVRVVAAGTPGLEYEASVDGNTFSFANVQKVFKEYRACATITALADDFIFSVAGAVNAHLYDDEAGVYMDRCVDGRFTGMLTPASFMPLYAGFCPHTRAQRLCRDYLLNPDRFYTTMPFPTLDRSHVAFRSGGYQSTHSDHPGALVNQAYWIGRSWPHVSFWMVGAIHRSGLPVEARTAAGRILDAMTRNEGINECYDALTGDGVGHPEYNWSQAAALALAFELYARPVGVGDEVRCGEGPVTG
jgi:hypothetical protein